MLSGKCYRTFALVSALSVVSSLGAFTLSSSHEPATLHTPYGIAKRALPSKKNQLELATFAYYQHASRAKVDSVKDVSASLLSNGGGDTTVQIGDRLGRINMVGLLFGDGPSGYETGKKFADGPAETSVLHGAYDAIKTEDSDYLSNYVSPTEDKIGFYSTAVKYQRFGVRTSLDYSFKSGLGLSVKGGIAQYEIRPSYRIWDSSNNEWRTMISTTPTGVEGVIHDSLLTSAKRTEIGTMLGRDFGPTSTTKPEDMSVEVFWRKGFDMKDAKGEHVVTTTPHIGIGLMLPVAHKKNINKVFDISLGNDGFYGVSFDADLNFSFPDMLAVGFGGEVSFFDQDTRTEYMPTSEYQQTLFPWKTKVSRRPGTVWKAHAYLVAPHFIDFLNAYFSYQFIVHEKDSLTVTGSNALSFLVDKARKASEYSAQLIHIGFDYEVTPALKFGVAAQSVFDANKAVKTTTIGGSLTFVF